MGTDLLLNLLGGLLADGPDLVVAVVVVDDILDLEDDWSGAVGEGGDTNLVTKTRLGPLARIKSRTDNLATFQSMEIPGPV